MTMRAEQVTAAYAEHGEGPVWSEACGGLRWLDMLRGDVLSLDDAGAVSRTRVGSVAALIRPLANGGAVLALENEVVVTAGSLRELNHFTSLPVHSGLRLNEGGCAPDGSLFCGTAPVGATRRPGALYRVLGNGDVQIELTNVGVANGLDFSPDGRMAYFVDTTMQRIDAFDYTPEAGLSNRRTFVQIAAEDGLPDGLTVDNEGGVWVALFGGGKVHRYDANGHLDQVVEVPTPQVAACTFGGPNLDRLFVTTSKRRVAVEELDRAGALYVVECGMKGKPTLGFNTTSPRLTEGE